MTGQDLAGDGLGVPGRDTSLADGQKRQDIVAAAQELFGEIGYDKTGVREIAERANVALATIYSYFDGGKVGILRAALEDRIRLLVAHALDSAEADPVDQFFDMVRRLNRGLTADPLLRRILSERGRVSEPRLREKGHEFEELIDAFALTRLHQLQARGLVRCEDPEAVVVLLRTATQGWLVAEGRGEGKVPHERVFDVLLDAVRALIVARP